MQNCLAAHAALSCRMSRRITLAGPNWSRFCHPWGWRIVDERREKSVLLANPGAFSGRFKAAVE